MKDSPYLSNILSEADVAAFAAVAKAPDQRFDQLVRLAGLDPARDFRYSDLKGVDFSYSDLRGFNFTGADLRDAFGILPQWDKTTVLDSADLTGSIFAAKDRLDKFFSADELARYLLTNVGRGSWSEQAGWAATHLQSSGKHHDIAVPIVEALFYRADDEFLKAELLRYVAPRIRSSGVLREILLAAVSDKPNFVTLVKTALNLVRHHALSHDPVIRQTALALVNSEKYSIREQAVQFVLRTSPTQEETALIRQKAEAGDHLWGALYVAEIVRRIGDEYDLVTRDPESNARFHLYERVTSERRDLVAQRWLRAEAVIDEKLPYKPLAQRRGGNRLFTRAEIEARARDIDTMWESLVEYGIKFQWERTRDKESAAS